MDINQSDTLQRTSAREERDEKHICPLQLEVIRRAINLWTNPGDIVLSPFARNWQRSISGHKNKAGSGLALS